VALEPLTLTVEQFAVTHWVSLELLESPGPPKPSPEIRKYWTYPS